MIMHGTGTSICPSKSKSFGLHFISEKDVYFFVFNIQIENFELQFFETTTSFIYQSDFKRILTKSIIIYLMSALSIIRSNDKQIYLDKNKMQCSFYYYLQKKHCS